MTAITIFDPAMCCSTGICGAEVDQNLVNFAADLDWLDSKGIKVTRINLSQEPAEFAANDIVKSVLEKSGVDGLPVVLFGGQMHSTGRYPARAELAKLAGVDFTPDTDEKPESSCCGNDDSAAEDAPTGCC